MTYTAPYGAGEGGVDDSPQAAPALPHHAQFLGGYVSEAECAEELGISRARFKGGTGCEKARPGPLSGRR